ncbi:protein phosphatase 2C domain-containing protein [Sphingomonas sp. LHG3406-1]|uniref:PP2C family protein-serine/threonine phosphatase n=1 Tax=Sphingomonas sp. LHG3406-1 TaxID=2804617 RepID=UPI002633FDF0|nr:protein phosphatase 2C domain-containing protein [Sphingomonas sp. LHG3406-1]
MASDVGRVRANNEDRCAVSAAAGCVTGWRGVLASEGGWAVLADGVGGHVAGEVAATLAIEVMRPLLAGVRTDEDVQRAVNAADQAIFMAMDMRPELRGMATTIAGAVFQSGQVITFNAGDSRAYSFENGTLTQRSKDDVRRGGALLQCLGGFQEPVPLFVHVRHFKSSASVLLCSDGLTDLLPDKKIEALLRQNPDDPARALVDAALAAGGHDNVSVIFMAPS